MATLLQKAMLFRGLLSGQWAYTGPFHAMIDLTRRCNLNCIGCRFHSPVVHRPSPSDPRIHDMSWDLYERLCRQLQGAGTPVIFLMGEGEPLLHPDLFRMIAFAKELGFHVAIISNGTLVDKSVARELVAAGTDRLQVSLWALSDADYAAQYPGADPENFQRCLEGLRRLSLEKQKRNSRLPSLILHHPINRRNLSSLEAIADFAVRAGCDGVSLSPFLSVTGCGDALLLSEDEERRLMPRLRALKRTLRRLGLRENIDTVMKRYAFVPLRRKTPACYAGWFHTRVRVDGTTVPCGACDIVMGRLAFQSFEEVWNGPEYRRFRRCVRTYRGLRRLMADKGYCDYCCYAQDNIRIERFVRGWLHRWLRFRGRASES